ncbi:hypothetical protein M0812_09827 [Anaeramoeba flamelloides]|uniref:Uncharacterized protein n=1 Tax=Anaeramoeba flamelloides TaxID=1746091 RepID=A0AAV7ZPM4_9EUKA|nr:hypothetical protein M0812_09827 [Anaeramoeba flamelloides]
MDPSLQEIKLVLFKNKNLRLSKYTRSILRYPFIALQDKSKKMQFYWLSKNSDGIEMLELPRLKLGRVTSPLFNIYHGIPHFLCLTTKLTIQIIRFQCNNSLIPFTEIKTEEEISHKLKFSYPTELNSIHNNLTVKRIKINLKKSLKKKMNSDFKNKNYDQGDDSNNENKNYNKEEDDFEEIYSLELYSFKGNLNNNSILCFINFQYLVEVKIELDGLTFVGNTLNLLTNNENEKILQIVINAKYVYVMINNGNECIIWDFDTFQQIGVVKFENKKLNSQFEKFSVSKDNLQIISCYTDGQLILVGLDQFFCKNQKKQKYSDQNIIKSKNKDKGNRNGDQKKNYLEKTNVFYKNWHERNLIKSQNNLISHWYENDFLNSNINCEWKWKKKTFHNSKYNGFAIKKKERNNLISIFNTSNLFNKDLWSNLIDWNSTKNDSENKERIKILSINFLNSYIIIEYLKIINQEIIVVNNIGDNSSTSTSNGSINNSKNPHKKKTLLFLERNTNKTSTIDLDFKLLLFTSFDGMYVLNNDSINIIINKLKPIHIIENYFLENQIEKAKELTKLNNWKFSKSKFNIIKFGINICDSNYLITNFQKLELNKKLIFLDTFLQILQNETKVNTNMKNATYYYFILKILNYLIKEILDLIIQKILDSNNHRIKKRYKKKLVNFQGEYLFISFFGLNEKKLIISLHSYHSLLMNFRNYFFQFEKLFDNESQIIVKTSKKIKTMFKKIKHISLNNLIQKYLLKGQISFLISYLNLHHLNLFKKYNLKFNRNPNHGLILIEHVAFQLIEQFSSNNQFSKSLKLLQNLGQGELEKIKIFTFFTLKNEIRNSLIKILIDYKKITKLEINIINIFQFFEKNFEKFEITKSINFKNYYFNNNGTDNGNGNGNDNDKKKKRNKKIEKIIINKKNKFSKYGFRLNWFINTSCATLLRISLELDTNFNHKKLLKYDFKKFWLNSLNYYLIHNDLNNLLIWINSVPTGIILKNYILINKLLNFTNTYLQKMFLINLTKSRKNLLKLNSNDNDVAFLYDNKNILNTLAYNELLFQSNIVNILNNNLLNNFINFLIKNNYWKILLTFLLKMKN